MAVKENIFKIEELIQKACNSAGRTRGEITLMGVTKFCPIEKIKKAYECGIRCFGESRGKEAAEKFSNAKDIFSGAQLHLIGSLQRNKVKQAVSFFDCIQSVDRNELIDELVKNTSFMEGKTEAEHSRKLSVLIELHTGEDSKNGYATFDELFNAAELLLKTGSLMPLGLMTMAPFTDDAKLIRASFRKLVKAQEELKKRFPLNQNGKNWDILSMGMSNDFTIAIEEGSTLLRIGSAIFKD